MSSPIEIDALIRELGDRKAALDFIGRYLRAVAGRLGAVESALAVGDARLVQREAHAIKGGAMSIMAGELCSSAAILEADAKNAILDRGAEQLAVIRSSLAVSNEFFEKWKSCPQAGS
jgi:HPt (histidine-containing phosphotransfer) domain-containing protein